MSYKIEQDYEKCIGCGSCSAVCSANWEMKDDGKAHPIQEEVEEIGCNKEAEDICPVQSIRIIKK